MGCILSICLETLLGNVQGAINHLHGGGQILRSWKINRSSSEFARISVEKDIVPIFDHLNCNSFIYGRIASPTSDQSLNIIEFQHDRFKSARDARNSLLKLLTASQQFAASSATVTRDSATFQHVLEQKEYLVQLSQKVDNLFRLTHEAAKNDRFPDSEFVKVRTLMLQHKIAAIWILNVLHTDEMSLMLMRKSVRKLPTSPRL